MTKKQAYFEKQVVPFRQKIRQLESENQSIRTENYNLKSMNENLKSKLEKAEDEIKELLTMMDMSDEERKTVIKTKESMQRLTGLFTGMGRSFY